MKSHFVHTAVHQLYIFMYNPADTEEACTE